MKAIIVILFLCLANIVFAQVNWMNVDSLYGPLPSSIHVYKTTDSLDGKPNIAYYVEASMESRDLIFDSDTSRNRRITLSAFYEKNNHPLVVVNTSFFSYTTNKAINVVMKNGKMVAYNNHSFPGRRKDTLTYQHPLGSAIGITKKHKADVAWIFTDSTNDKVYALQQPVKPLRDSFNTISLNKVQQYLKKSGAGNLKKWKMKAAAGGGPVLVQYGEIAISNNEELRFAGNAVKDKHPRTAMGYTGKKTLIILVVEGRHPGIAEGADLLQLASLLKGLGCVEALNLDGGGSSGMLVNGKPTITVSDKEGQRPVPAAFIIKERNR